MAKSAREKLAQKKEIKTVLLEKDFAGIRKGELMLVATPQIVADYISDIPTGSFQTIPEMRDNLAKQNGCDGTCPVSTAIFVRMAAEAALEDMNEGHNMQV